MGRRGWRGLTVAAVAVAGTLMAAGMAVAAGAAEDAAGWEGIELVPGLGLGAQVEVEASLEKQGSDENSDINVTTFEVGLEAAPMDGVRGEVTLLWEEGETDSLEVDSAVLTLGGTEDIPLAVSAGRMYLPFGAFNSLMVSDPLPLELGETRETAVALCGEWMGFEAWAGAFTGELDDAEDITKGAAAVAWRPVEGLALGVSVLSHIGEGGGYVDDLNQVLADSGSYDDAPGVSTFVMLELNPVTIAAEYLGAVKDMKWTDAEGQTTSAQPQAWHLDVAWAFTDNWSAAVRYEGSKKFKSDEMPEHQGGAALFWQVNAFVTIGLEYLYGTFDAEDVDDRQLATVQVALEF